MVYILTNDEVLLRVSTFQPCSLVKIVILKWTSFDWNRLRNVCAVRTSLNYHSSLINQSNQRQCSHFTSIKFGFGTHRLVSLPPTKWPVYDKIGVTSLWVDDNQSASSLLRQTSMQPFGAWSLLKYQYLRGPPLLFDNKGWSFHRRQFPYLTTFLPRFI